MGNVFSSVLAPGAESVTGESEAKIMASNSADNGENEESHDTIEKHDNEERNRLKEVEMEQFRCQLLIKREQRREILDRHKAEKKELEMSLENETKAKLATYESNRLLRELLIKNNIEIPEDLQSFKENIDIKDTILNMKEEFEKLRENNNKLRRDLAESNNALQGAHSDIADLQFQNTESMKQIRALKEVVSVSKTMLGLREQQLDELKSKLSDIERSLTDRETNMLSTELRQEYERQLQNIRTLRGLYEERARLAEVTRLGLVRDLEEQKALKLAESERVKELSTKVQDLESRVDELQEMMANKNNQLYSSQDETRGLRSEMAAVNKLFSHVLLGYKEKKDLDKLVHRLEENHGILTHMAENENDSEASTALPKLLLEIVSQVDEEDGDKNKDPKMDETEGNQNGDLDGANTNSATAEEIIQNLPKVWRVLMELLSHQSAPEDNTNEKVTTCYKTVETKSGPVQVPSVSQTYIRLKDLIIEKLGLVKEVNRMKQLNTHLETRLEEQERRLCLVTNELSKTWHVVGRLRRHHHQLHTHEKILKYELQQKRKLLNELKEELEYCREKWDQAREKNTQSEKDWKKLRAEFSSRKTKSTASLNNSAESGYSDERPSDESSESNDESEYVTEPIVRSKKKLKKSFETILDSSTDRNLAAEREDPASDMLDVAELPHDGDDQNDISESNSESLFKSERICETEDEVCDIAHDSCTEDISVADCSQASDSGQNETTIEVQPSSAHSVPKIDPAAILESIRKQNERLAKKDKKLEKLEKSGAALLQQAHSTAKISNQLNNTLDHILDRPSTSAIRDSESKTINDIPKVELDIQETNQTQTLNLLRINDGNDQSTTLTQNVTQATGDFDTIFNNVKTPNERHAKTDERLQKLEKDCIKIVKNISKSIVIDAGDEIDSKLDRLQAVSVSSENHNNISKETDNIEISSSVADAPSTSETVTPNVDFKAILENVKKQNERLTNKDKRLQNLETSCSEVISSLTKTLSTGQEITDKIDSVHKCGETRTSEIVNEELLKDCDGNRSGTEKPSTSNMQISAVDFRSILESVKRQDERLEKKDDRLLENDCAEVVNKISSTLCEGNEIIDKLDTLHQANNENTSGEKRTDTENSSNPSSRGSSEPSTSSEIDHEARFAARDIRLKRLEEQTKSLVSKVNKTTDKGVKIHYKLEELHNIYGSENSRASTPSDNGEINELDKSNGENTDDNE